MVGMGEGGEQQKIQDFLVYVHHWCRNNLVRGSIRVKAQTQEDADAKIIAEKRCSKCKGGYQLRDPEAG